MKALRTAAWPAVLVLCTSLTPAHADWRARLNRLRPALTNAPARAPGDALAALTQDEIAKALREALAQAARKAVADLGRPGGFLDNLNVRIPVPPQLERVDRALRLAHQDKVADDFHAAMNRAAERAVPAGASVLATAVSQLTLDDARRILKGPDDGATQFFRRTSSAALTERFLPIVSNTTAQVGVTSCYKSLVTNARFLGRHLKQDAMDLDGYITRKTLDGLFRVMTDEEREIRRNPKARTSELLRRVFGTQL